MKIPYAAVAAITAALLSAPSATAQVAVQWAEAEGGNGHWYKMVERPFQNYNWNATRKTAIAVGGDLADFQSEAEWLFVAPLVESLVGHPDHGPQLLAGGFQLDGSGDASDGWVWIDGSPLTYEAWKDGFPNNPGIASVLSVNLSEWTSGQAIWDDRSYNDLSGGYIIEWSADCNKDGLVDYGQILDGTLVDTDQNGVPDWCDSCTGDVNGDGAVDAADLGALLALWGTNGNSSPRADANRDGTVDAADLGLLLGYWGDCP